MVQLPDDLEASRAGHGSFTWKRNFNQIINAIRIHNVPVLNVCIVALLGFFLVKLTTKYTELYMKNSLVTIIVTNLVLYGISETLAQSILSFSWDAPGFSFILLGPAQYDPLIGQEPRQNQPDVSEELRNRQAQNDDPGSDDSDITDDDLDQFLRYLRSDTSLPYQDLEGADPAAQTYNLSYFKFGRLAGFMCWGFVMAFVQCWWYRFLQIYSKHPQFVEVLRKVMSDQFCFLPVSLFCFFTYGTMILENGSWSDAKAKLNKLYLQTLVINYCVWFPVQFFNFLLVPRDYQVPFSSSVAVLWNCFLSMRNSAS